jgi:hypothetical protein
MRNLSLRARRDMNGTKHKGLVKMGKTVATLAVMAFAGIAHAETFHYSCKSGDSRYALTVNTKRSALPSPKLCWPPPTR